MGELQESITIQVSSGVGGVFKDVSGAIGDILGVASIFQGSFIMLQLL